MIEACKNVVIVVTALMASSCGSCADNGPAGWTLAESWPEGPGTVARHPSESAFEPIAPDDSAFIPREPTSLGGRDGAGPVGDISLADADVVLTDPYREIRSVDYAGDVNGDGFDDVLLGNPNCCSYWNEDFDKPNRRGAAFLVYGGPRTDIRRRQVLSGDYAMFIGAQQREQLGSNVVGLGDVDGDGLHDFALAAPRDEFLEDPAKRKIPSRLYLFYGRSTRHRRVHVAEDVADAIIQVDTWGMGSEADGGDFNGDGFDDIIVSNRGVQPNRPVYMFLGGNTRRSGTFSVAESDGGLSLTGGEFRFPHDLHNVGDLDGDGVEEFSAGATYEDFGAGPGVQYVYPGTAPVSEGLQEIDEAAWSFRRPGSSYDGIGELAAGGGDVDDDGYDDFLVGDTNRGVVFLIGGRSGFPNRSDLPGTSLPISGPSDSHRYPSGLAGGGDVNGDGFDDFAVGLKRTSGEAPGEVHLYYGRPDLTLRERLGEADADARFEGTSPFDSVGKSVALNGDFDGDGFADIVIAADQFRVYVVYGGGDRQ